MDNPIRILVTDDHPVVRDGLIAVLGTQPDFEVVGEAASGDEAVEQALDLAPDVILLDLEMPGLDGVGALKAIRSNNPSARVIVFTAYDSDDLIVAAVQSGAQGYLLKGAPREEIFHAIRVVHHGGSLLQPVVASKLLRHVRSDRSATVRARYETLTPRESEVLALLAEGMSNKEIAAALSITERTVKFHVSSIFLRLGAANRTEAVRLAAQRGLVEL